MTFTSPTALTALDGIWAWVETPFGQTLVATTMATVISAMLLAIGAFLFKKAKGYSMWSKIWASISKSAKWAIGVRLTSRTVRQSLVASGYAKRSAEVADQRKHVDRPVLFIDQRGALAEDHVFIVRNTGYPVTDVGVTADSSELALRYPAFWPGAFGDRVLVGVAGHGFEGDLTDKGRASGVTFTITYRDQNGDYQEESFFLPAERLHSNAPETPAQAHERGRRELEAEIAAQRSKPVIRPAWALARDLKEKGRFLIANTAAGSFAKDVEIEAAPHTFTFLGAPRWDNLNGNQQASFYGKVGEYGGLFSATVTVSWTDENSERWDLAGVPIHNTKISF